MFVGSPLVYKVLAELYHPHLTVAASENQWIANTKPTAGPLIFRTLPLFHPLFIQCSYYNADLPTHSKEPWGTLILILRYIFQPHFRYRVMLKFYNSHFPLSTSLTTATFIVLVNGKGAMSQSAAKPCLSIMRKRMVLQIWDARKMLHAFGTNAKGRCRDIILCAIRVSITSPTQGNDTTQSKHSRTRCISLLHCNILQLLRISSLFCSDLVQVMSEFELSYTQHFQM